MITSANYRAKATEPVTERVIIPLNKIPGAYSNNVVSYGVVRQFGRELMAQRGCRLLRTSAQGNVAFFEGVERRVL